MNIGDKIINRISDIKKDRSRRVLAVLSFIFIGILSIIAVFGELFFRIFKAAVEECVLYFSEIKPRLKNFFSEYMRLW